jgi:hypothetical protein
MPVRALSLATVGTPAIGAHTLIADGDLASPFDKPTTGELTDHLHDDLFGRDG